MREQIADAKMLKKKCARRGSFKCISEAWVHVFKRQPM
jgi:hypothetical protein